ncbi:polysaccharide biosynthesis/export family protein [Sphingopyxis sp. MSC1_008]|jgi:polysaccharide export outer membrane protein|uniref:polysaccharide biosynthesis/export family protein n=1 Tax=Sphingopyxis sp. MSC1_008 TaxID=2909265 RepID=UPI0020BED168|nr:polysaccharide biosynthesis/export family protein [Sphingopyxis sp. MSC1_008]
MRRMFLTGALMMVALSACAGQRELGGSPAISVVNERSLRAPDGSPAETADRTYRVGARDKLLVDVFGIEELKARDFETDGTGQLALPLAGRIDANNRTLAELEAEVVQRLRLAHVRNPQVSINVREINSRTVTLDGSVREPGSYPAVSDLTLMRAVARAKGVTEYAKLDDVVVFRTVEGRQMVALYNLGAIRRGAYEDPPLFANDVVVVGESQGRRLFQSIVQAGALVTAPIVALLQR